MRIQSSGVGHNNCKKDKQNLAFGDLVSPYTLCGIQKSFNRLSVEEKMMDSSGVKSLSAKLWASLEKLNKYKKNDLVDVHLHPEGDAIWAIISPGEPIQKICNPIHGSGQELVHSHILCAGDEFISEIDKHAQEIEKNTVTGFR